MEFVISIAEKIGEYLVAPIGRQFGYVLFYKSRVVDFKKQVEELEDKKVEVEGLVSMAKGNGDLILPAVTSWLEDVDKITQESRSRYFCDEAQASKRCFNVPFPDYKLRYKRGKKATKNTEVAKELQKKGSFERVSIYVRPPATRFKSTQGVEYFESRKATLKQVMKAIEDPMIKMIGIYGMGGVGKTTLVKEVAEQVEVRNQFKEIVMGVVSQTLNLEKIQQQIAEMLDLKFEGESQLGRAERLHLRLKQIEKVLIILDDIWSPINLGDIGIPFGVEHEGCKIVITSRSQDVCNQMATQKNVIKVGILEKEEAWNLFRKMAGDRVDSPEIKPLASKVVKRCAGLPIAIVTIARALKDKSLSFWKDAANVSRMSKEVSSTLQLSYNYLESEEAKSLFLLCCIYGEDHNIAIEDLWKYGMGLGSFQDVHNVEAARDRTYALAEYLKYSCLLQEGSSNHFVKMHDVVRDFAISVASKDEHGFLVRSGPGSNEFPDSSQFIRYTTISLISDAIQKFPDDKLECLKLELLYLECTHPSLQIPDKFFSGMKKLKVLVMCNMHFKRLPPSLRDLENLQTLCLSNCNLLNVDVSIIGTLNGLKFLSFIGCAIGKLPKKFGELSHLKLLDLSRCRMLKIIPHQVILRLSELEGLYMGDSFRSWEIAGQSMRRSNVSLEDLNHLISLDIVVQDENCLPDSEDPLFKNLKRFHIYIGKPVISHRRVQKPNYYLHSKALMLESVRNFPLKLLSTPLKTTEYLYLGEIRHGLGSVLYDLEGDSFLKCLTVKDCDELEYVFNTKDSILPATLSSLEKLDLYKLPNLKRISHGQLSNPCFLNLRVVNVGKCNGLKNLFSHFKATDLQQLSYLSVRDCEIMEEIFGDETGASLLESIVFPSLQVLELSYLPKLINFCSKNKCTDTHMKNPLFHEKVMFPVLEKLMIDKVNMRDIWDHQLLGNFKNLSSIWIDKCDNLKSLFQSSMASSLGQLQEVVIQRCLQMETIILEERDANGESCMERVIVFPGLRKLRLWILPNLASFYQMACPDLTQPQSLFSVKVVFPVLEELELSNVNVKDICHHQLLDNFKIFSSIRTNCDNLKSIFRSSMASSLGQLQKVKIDSWKTMETIIANEKQGEEEDCTEMINVFPQLRNLELQSLPSFPSFYLGTIGDRIDHALFNKKVLFPSLEMLVLVDIHNLKEIWHPQILASSFSQLRVLRVSGCGKLSSVVSSGLLQSFQSLEELSVVKCDLLEAVVIEVEGHEVNELIFPHLRKLKLQKLPKLKHIMCWDKYPLGTLSFQSVIEIDIFECDSLKSLIPPWVASTLVQLQKLNIRSCEQMETVIAKERQGEENCLNWPSLKFLGIAGCPAMKRFTANIPCPQNHQVLSKEAPQPGRPCPFFHNKVALASLEQLYIDDMENVEEIFDNQLSDESLCQLKELSVNRCYKLLRVVPSNLLPRLKKLRQLTVTNCNLVEEISGQGLGEGHATTISFSDLYTLKLENLPNLKIFCSGKYKIECPSLYLIRLKNCPKIQTFSSGFTSAPVLKIIHLEGKEYMLKDDLNTTVQQIFHEKEPQRSVHQNIDSTEDSGVVTGDEPPRIRKWRIISSEEKGKAKVLDEGSEKVSQITATSSHQLPPGSGISLRGSAMEDPQPPKVDGYIDVSNTNIFPDDIARRPLGDQNVRHNTDPGQGFVTLTENDAEADMSTQNTFLLRGANHTRPVEMFTRYQAEVESFQSDRDLLRHRVETLEDLFNHSRTDEMVIGYRAKIESLQRDRELMRRRVETLEDSISHARTNEMIVRPLQKDRDIGAEDEDS